MLTTAYLIGNIRFAYIICHFFNLQSPSSYGSQNPGATNVSRQDKKAGILTLLLDGCKPATAYLLCLLVTQDQNLAILSMFMTTFGHIFPLLGPGGKGISCWLASVMIISPLYGFCFLLLITFTWSKWREVGLGSIIGTMIMATVPPGMAFDLTVCFQFTSLIILFAHRDNIHRLILSSKLKWG